MASDRTEVITTMMKSYDEVIHHYDFVINDISGVIYNPLLEAKKGPVIEFLNEMKKAWETCKADLQQQL